MNIKSIITAALITILPMAASAQQYTEPQIECAVDYFSTGDFADVRNTHDLLEVSKATGSINLALAATTCALKEPSMKQQFDELGFVGMAIAMSAFEPPLSTAMKLDEDKIPFIKLPRDRALWAGVLGQWAEDNPDEYEELLNYAKTLGPIS